jgi:hypothetical protein
VELTSSSLVTDPSAAGSRAYSTPPNAALFIYAQTEHLHQPIMQHHHTCHSKPSKLGKKEGLPERLLELNTPAMAW